MKRLFILTGLVCLSFMLLPACAPEPVQEAEPATEEAPNTEADVAAINAILNQYAETVTAGDADGFMALFVEDCVMLPPNAPTIVGKDACRSYVKSTFFDPFDLEEELASQETAIAKDWAFVRGTYTLQVTPKAGGEITPIDGKFILLFERQSDDSWKITHQIWNSDNPPPVAPTS